MSCLSSVSLPCSRAWSLDLSRLSLYLSVAIRTLVPFCQPRVAFPRARSSASPLLSSAEAEARRGGGAGLLGCHQPTSWLEGPWLPCTLFLSVKALSVLPLSNATQIPISARTPARHRPPTEPPDGHHPAGGAQQRHPSRRPLHDARQVSDTFALALALCPALISLSLLGTPIQPIPEPRPLALNGALVALWRIRPRPLDEWALPIDPPNERRLPGGNLHVRCVSDVPELEQWSGEW